MQDDWYDGVKTLIAYPMGVLGVILSFIILRFALRVDKQKEEDEANKA